MPQVGDAWRALVPILADWAAKPDTDEGRLTVLPGSADDRRFSAARWWDEAPWRQLLPLVAAGGDAVFRIAPLYAALGEVGPQEQPEYRKLDARWTLPFPPKDSPLHSALSRLREGAVDDVVATILADDGDPQRAALLAQRLTGPGTSTVPASAKLAGTGVFNFGGFLSTEWRTSDWWWGRIDAAAFLGGQLAAEGAARKDTDREAVVLADLVAQERLGGVETPGSAEVGSLLTGGRGGLARLAGTYLTATVGRLLRVAGRALPHVDNAATGWSIRVTGHLLAPLLVFATAVLQPMRLVAAMAALLTGVVLCRAATEVATGDSERSVALLIVLCAAVAIAIAVLGVGARTAAKRWMLIDDDIIPATVLPPVRRDALARRSRLRTWRESAGVLGAIGFAFASWVADETVLAVIAASGALVAAPFVSRRMRMVPPPQVPRHAADRAWRVVAVVAVVVAVLAVAVMVAAALAPASMQWLTLGWPVLGVGGVWMLAGLLIAGVLLLWDVLGRGAAWWLPVVATVVAAAPVVWASVAIASVAPTAAVALVDGGWIGWVWAAAVILWGNVMWIVPMWWTLSAPSWTDDGIVYEQAPVSPVAAAG